MSKKCIWCSKSENTSFNNHAHIVPQSLGGKLICENVCDECNSYMGAFHNQTPSIDLVIKELFSISREVFIRHDLKNIRNNHNLRYRFNSTYFSISKTKQLSLKPRFALTKNFQDRLGKQLKKGLFKMYLEELNRMGKDVYDDKYNFIREFVRFDLVEIPVLYFERTNGIIVKMNGSAVEPQLLLCENKPMKYLLSTSQFDEFEFFGHVFGIPISKISFLSFESYIRESMKLKSGIFHNVKLVNNFNDIDFTLKIFNDKR